MSWLRVFMEECLDMTNDKNIIRDGAASRFSYKRPCVERIDLAIDETLAAGCKVTPADLNCQQVPVQMNELGS